MRDSNSKRKQPLSLRWKWGIFLFVIFSSLFFLVLKTYSHYSHKIQIEAYQEQEKESFIRVQNYMINHLSQDRTDLQGLTQTLKRLSLDEVTIVIKSPNNEILYQTRPSVSLPEIEPDHEWGWVESNGEEYLVGVRTLLPYNYPQNALQIEYYAQPRRLLALVNDQDRLINYLILVSVILTLIASFLLSHRFLRFLTYLNNSLDLVEEESLSDIRVRKPRSDDEWSDLSLHVNRLLDKIDSYVTNQKQFVEDVSHELRTPVAIVEGHLKLLQRWGKDDPKVLAESIDASLQEITRMKGLVQEMLDLSRADHVDVDYKDSITEIYSTAKQVYNNFVILYPDFNIFLDSDEDSTPAYVRMYRNHFEQILIILLDNAVKYSTDRQEIHLSVSRSINQIEIAVQDFGEGMSEEDKEKVFGRFYRVDKARSRDKGGNGLGLSIAQQLVTTYRGKIWVDSSLNHGSIFYIELPLITSTETINKLLKIEAERDSF
ncbi:sensor histidine kinase [Hutsoniella sourekii]